MDPNSVYYNRHQHPVGQVSPPPPGAAAVKTAQEIVDDATQRIGEINAKASRHFEETASQVSAAHASRELEATKNRAKLDIEATVQHAKEQLDNLRPPGGGGGNLVVQPAAAAPTGAAEPQKPQNLAGGDAFVAWTDTPKLHQITAKIKRQVEWQKTPQYLANPHMFDLPPIAAALDTPMKYRGKVKLHGKNAAVAIRADGRVRFQGRSMYAVQGLDIGAMFPKIVADKPEQYWRDLFEHDAGYDQLTIFGEVCGPTIQKGVAVVYIERNIFAVFAIRRGNSLIIEPDQIWNFLTRKIADLPASYAEQLRVAHSVYVLPWKTGLFSMDFRVGRERSLATETAKIAEHVNAIEKRDPWVFATFGVDGMGEGLVLYPVSLESSDGTISAKAFSAFVFKSKVWNFEALASGKASKGGGGGGQLRIYTQEFAALDDFLAFVCNDSRLTQGLTEQLNGVLDKKLADKFAKWVLSDAKKECSDELAELNLKMKGVASWKSIGGKILDKAKKWYFAEIRKGQAPVMIYYY